VTLRQQQQQQQQEEQRPLRAVPFCSVDVAVLLVLLLLPQRPLGQASLVTQVAWNHTVEGPERAWLLLQLRVLLPGICPDEPQQQHHMPQRQWRQQWPHCFYRCLWQQLLQ